MKYVLFLLLFSATLQVSAQEAKPLYSFSLISPAIGIEKGLQENNSLKFSVGSISGYGNKEGFQTKSAFIRGEYRHYYNLPKRRDEGRLSTNYSGNYVGLFAEPSFVFKKGEEASTMYAGGVWGIQRNYNSHFLLDLSLIAGIGQNGFESKAGLRIGFWLK
jgi:hypothetical protein